MKVSLKRCFPVLLVGVLIFYFFRENHEVFISHFKRGNPFHTIIAKLKNKLHFLATQDSDDTVRRVGTLATTRGRLEVTGGFLCNGEAAVAVDHLDTFNEMLQSRRDNPGEKYLVYRSKWGFGGFGDRLKGIANVFLWSVLTNRTFVIKYTDPHPIQDCLEPNLVNWDVTVPETGKVKTEAMYDGTLGKRALLRGDLATRWKLYDVVEIIGANVPSEPRLRNNSHYDLNRLGFPKPCGRLINQTFAANSRKLNVYMHFWQAMVLHTLFKPSKALLDLTRSVLEEMATFDVTIGVHVRIGGTVGGVTDPSRVGPDCRHNCLPEDFDWKLWFSACALNRTFAEEKQGHRVAWFVLSDKPTSELMFLYRSSELNGIPILTLEKKRVVHTDKSRDQTSREWMETVGDWYILSQTSQIIQSPSSFSLTAALWAGKQPLMLGESCVS